MHQRLNHKDTHHNQCRGGGNTGDHQKQRGEEQRQQKEHPCGNGSKTCSSALSNTCGTLCTKHRDGLGAEHSSYCSPCCRHKQSFARAGQFTFFVDKTSLDSHTYQHADTVEHIHKQKTKNGKENTNDSRHTAPKQAIKCQLSKGRC